ncbi:glycine cleavage system protein GcvH [Streptomyces griseiscabiei]|uniref:Glycine cleavage system H protein n=1 Tax=Streptomyces griseiscabiei TaxID=2993540 RepID=A0ABU4LMJ5_9ACTN|nr:glycine cleavage system protein GcvH [Streptomyces griseiscabiei]MBZ3908528.1 glycine cleavage system protein GcvH [Streptomyces griseiscabiei]MDX2916374.1 glycine cleavage system protein GcvH [Streptomyces griseiscabiei]
MSNIPAELRYAKSDEWVSPAMDGAMYVGISDYAQQQFGDFVFVGLPEVGKVVAAGDSAGSVESNTRASELIAPIGGEVIAVNEELSISPERLNEDPYASWIFKLTPSNAADFDNLLKADEYRAHISEG